MNCKEFKEKVSPMIDGMLSTTEEQEFLTHRAGCAKCDRYAVGIEKVNALLKAHPLPELPPELVQRLGEIELAETVPEIPWGPYVRNFLIAGGGAAAVLSVATLGPGYWRDIVITIIPAVGWAAVLVRLNLKRIIPAGFSLLEARSLTLAHENQ